LFKNEKIHGREGKLFWGKGGQDTGRKSLPTRRKKPKHQRKKLVRKALESSYRREMSDVLGKENRKEGERFLHP